MPRSKQATRDTFASEQELAAHVREYHLQRGWECYQEVQIGTGGKVADLVFKRPPDAEPCVRIVECKLSLTFGVMAQALAWKGDADELCIAVPGAAYSDARIVAYSCCRMLGLGCFVVTKCGDECDIEVASIPVPNPDSRMHAQALAETLVEQQTNFAAAGNAQGKRWTRSAGVLAELKRYAEQNPNALLRDAVRHVDHNFGTNRIANRRLAERFREGQIKDIPWKLDGEWVVLNPDY